MWVSGLWNVMNRAPELDLGVAWCCTIKDLGAKSEKGTRIHSEWCLAKLPEDRHSLWSMRCRWPASSTGLPVGATAPAAEAWCSSARGISLPAPCGVLCGEKAVPVPWAAAGVVREAGKVQRSTFSVEGESSNVWMAEIYQGVGVSCSLYTSFHAWRLWIKERENL